MENGILPLTEKILQQLKQNTHLDEMLIQKYYYQTNQKRYTQSNLHQSMWKVFGNLHSEQEEEQGHQDLGLNVGRDCLHQLNLEIAQLIYATLLLR